MRANGLLLRAIAALVALPGTVAFVVPLLIAPPGGPPRPWQWIGLVLVAAGSALLLRCVRDFYVAGRGTLAPWSPPRRLVSVGLYRRSRNPMYVAVTIVLLGWTVWFASTALLIYAVAVLAAFHLRILFYEEPRLAASFGEDWADYRRRIRRWL